MKLTPAQMRAIELMIEQQDRLTHFAKCRPGISMDLIVQEFYEADNRGAAFETMILSKIGKLLVPYTTEDLNLTVKI